MMASTLRMVMNLAPPQLMSINVLGKNKTCYGLTTLPRSANRKAVMALFTKLLHGIFAVPHYAGQLNEVVVFPKGAG